MRQTNWYWHAWKQNLDGDKNNPKISGASVTNFHLTLAWAKENFPVLRDLLGPIEPEISFFFQKSLTVLYNSSFNTQTPSFFSTNQHGAEQSLAQNVATNSHSVKYETLRFGHGQLVFLLYNLINKVLANIDTELCTHLNFFDLLNSTKMLSSFWKLDQTTFKRLKCITLMSRFRHQKVE